MYHKLRGNVYQLSIHVGNIAHRLDHIVERELDKTWCDTLQGSV